MSEENDKLFARLKNYHKDLKDIDGTKFRQTHLG